MRTSSCCTHSLWHKGQHLLGQHLLLLNVPTQSSYFLTFLLNPLPGVRTTRVPLHHICPDKCDWRSLPVYYLLHKFLGSLNPAILPFGYTSPWLKHKGLCPLHHHFWAVVKRNIPNLHLLCQGLHPHYTHLVPQCYLQVTSLEME